MANSSSQFVGDIPGVYDKCLGPNIFEFYAGEMATRVAAHSPTMVLEQAAGTGIVTMALRSAMNSDATLVATDLNEPMLDVAKGKLDADAVTRFQQADAQDLPFEDASFDLVVVQFGHMFFPDRGRAYAEARRVLRPGGQYLFSTWAGHAENPFAALAQATYDDAFGDTAPQFYHVPFSLNDPAAILTELQQAGFHDTAHDAVAHESRLTDIKAFSQGLIYGNPGFLEVMELGGDPDALRADVEARLRDRFGSEPARMPLVAHFFSGRAT